MSPDRPVRCPINANVRRGLVKDLLCSPSCPHYSQSKKLEGIFRSSRRAKIILQRTARTGGKFPNCPNPQL